MYIYICKDPLIVAEMGLKWAPMGPGGSGIITQKWGGATKTNQTK